MASASASELAVERFLVAEEKWPTVKSCFFMRAPRRHGGFIMPGVKRWAWMSISTVAP